MCVTYIQKIEYNNNLKKMYEIIKLIGRGANGDVFLAKNKQDNSTQVIKKLKIRDISEKQRETIETQLRLLKQFKHVNIVPFKDSFIDPEGNLNIVMGYCEGGDMHNLITDAEGKKFEQKKIIDWVIQLALSIFYLHEKRVLHRDIKTQNIFLTNGKVMLGDFGVSKVLDQAIDLAVTNIGTPYYMSPEQYRQKPYSYKSDIWAFGCIIYEMCTHKHVFEALSLQGLAVKVLKGIFAPVSEEYSKQLRALIGQMLKQNPKDRPSIRQILVRPFLFGKVQNYMKKIYSQKQKYEPQMIKSLEHQAISLGFSLQEPKPKKIQTPETSTAKRQKLQSKTEQNRQKLKQQSYKKYEKLNEALKKEIEQRNRAQQELKRIQRQKSQKKKSTQKYSFQKVKTKRDEISKSEKSTNSSRSKIKLEDIRSSDPGTQQKIHAKVEQQKQQLSKNFKIEEEYDMDYEQYSDKEDNQINKIYEEDEQQQQKVTPATSTTPKTEPEKPKQTANSNIFHKEKIEKIEPKQIKKQEDPKIKQDLLQKEVKQKTCIISNIRNEMSKLDFALSSDSDQSQKQQRSFNPAYIRINQKINDLKQKVIDLLGKNGFITLLDYIRNNYGKGDRNKAVQMVGEQNVGVWHLAENIIRFERVLSKIPVYVNS